MSLPVTVLTGFLGAGKTTLVNRLLKELPGTRFGLIVNEFGEAALETQLVENRKRPIHELPSGCLCCVSDGDLKAALEALTHRDRKIDHILVEASGLSSPGPMLGLLAGDGPYRLSGVFCLVDATSFLAHEKDFPTLRKQLNFADAVFLTKTDLASADQVAAVETRLGSLKPGVRVLPSSGRLPWGALFDAEAAPKAPEAGEAGAGRRRFFQGGKHHEADVFEYSDPTPLDPVKLGRVFAALPAGVLRAKGVVNLADRSAQKHKYIVQYTGAQKQLYSRPWGRDEQRQTDLLFIGTGLDAAALRRDLDACRVGAP